MRKRIVFILSFVLISYSCTTQPKLTETQKLESLAKIWGFLKYYHPNVANGKLNWDNELIQYFPKVKSAQSKDELSQIYLDWIERLGEIKNGQEDNFNPNLKWNENLGVQKEKEIDTKRIFDKNFNLNWTDDELLFSSSLISKLNFIEKNRFQGRGYYAKPIVGSLEFKNEAPYVNLSSRNPDEHYRLISLFRYWNIIEYFFPYKYLTDQNWNEVLTEMIPKFRDAKNASEYHLAVLELVAKVDDSHANISAEYTPEIFGPNWIPAKFKIIDSTAVITGFYNDSLAISNDIKIGDVIYKVDGEEISEIIKRKSKYIPASNQAVKLRKLKGAVFNGGTNSVKVVFERNGKVQEKLMKRYPFNDFRYTEGSKGAKWEILEGNIGYVNMGLVEIPDVTKMMESLIKCKAIIFDTRNYPHGTMYEIAKYLNSKPKPFAKFTVPNVISYPGKFLWLEDYRAGEQNDSPYTGKVVILVNEQTQSHAEFTVMCLQTANDNTVIGSQTAGADGNVIFFELVGGIKTSISGFGVYYPDGKETQRIGIVPDIEVKPTISGIRNGKDEVLEKALEYLK